MREKIGETIGFIFGLLYSAVFFAIPFLASVGSYFVLIWFFGGELYAWTSPFVYAWLMLLPCYLLYFSLPSKISDLDLSTIFGYLGALVIFVPLYFSLAYLLSDCLILTNKVETSLDMYDYSYFSYLTFSTLGYGDIVPTPICRPVAVTEAVCGMVSIAAIISLFYTFINRKT